MELLLMEFRELSDEEWELIKPLLPPKAKTGRLRADDRRVLNGILYVLATGCRWMDMPPKYGHYSTAFRGLKHWQTQGIWTRILKTLITKGYTIGKLSIEKLSVDSTTIEAKEGEHF
jgi:transposase